MGYYRSEFMEFDYKQRAYDGKWEQLAKVKDYENTYTYTTDSGQKISLIPEKWITIGVTDYMVELT